MWFVQLPNTWWLLLWLEVTALWSSLVPIAVLGRRGTGQHDPEVDAETAHSSATLEEQLKAGVLGPQEAALCCPCGQ